MSLRIIFMGTPDYSVPTLRALVRAGHEVVAVYSQPPRPSGRRGLETLPSPVHVTATELGIPVLTPRSMKSPEVQAHFAAFGADAAVVVAYGLILPEPVLAATRLGAWNGHASLLPRWRGAAPIQRAIMAGDEETGVMIMKMDKGLDTGAVALSETVAIAEDMTAGQLHDRLAEITARLMINAVADLETGGLSLVAQPDAGVTYASKIDKAETRIDFARPARAVHDHVRGLSPSPGAWFEAIVAGRVERVKVLRTRLAGAGSLGTAPGTILDDQFTVACAEDTVRLLELQKAGGRPLPAAEFLRGALIAPGTVLG